MARASCNKCNRPVKSCICHLFVSIENQVKLVVLQHPKEVNHPKGSGVLLANSLSHCEVLVGENFNENKTLLDIMEQHTGQVFLLYPSEGAVVITEQLFAKAQLKEVCLIVIDATWKKAYKMYQLSKCLHQLSAIKLPEGLSGNYLIRSTKKSNALSTLEACCHALSIIENDRLNYNPLLKSFAEFNQFQLSFKP